MAGVKGKSGGRREACCGERHHFWKGGVKSLNREQYMKDYLKKYWQQYRKDKPGVIQHNRFVHRQRYINAEGSHSIKEWRDLLKKCDGQCQVCGTREDISRDHIIPLAKGGSNYINNIQPLCLTCNKKKHTKL